MPQPINRVPPGLLSLLGIKSLGMNPAQLADELRGILDLTQLYTEAANETIFGTTPAVNAVGQFEFTNTGTRAKPNPGELWVVRRVAVAPTAALGAGTTYNVQLCTIHSTYGQVTGMIGQPISATVGASPATGSTEGVPFLVSANTSIALWCNSLTLGVAANFIYTAQICRLQV